MDFRDETFAELQGRLCGLRQRVWKAWQRHGPGTTREVARLSGIGLLTFRPRTTELLQMGLLIVEEREGSIERGSVERERSDAQTLGRSHEGIYRARAYAEWQGWYERERKAAVDGQLKLI